MVKTETSNEEEVLLLTGEKWGDKQFTTVKAELLVDGGTYWFDGGSAHLEPCSFEDCVLQAVKVPYMIGQKVRLTGAEYGKFIGEESKVVKYRVSGGFWVAVLENRFEVYFNEDTGADWSVTPVEDDPKTLPLEDWEARLIEHGKKEEVRKEVEDEIVAYLRRVEAEIRDDIQEMLYVHPNPDLARLKEYAAEAHAYSIISEAVVTGEYRD